jgi:ankyrin repeat protein
VVHQHDVPGPHRTNHVLFHNSIQFCDILSVELLLSSDHIDKTSVDHTDETGRTALMYASSLGHASVVDLLLASEHIDKTSVDLSTILM